MEKRMKSYILMVAVAVLTLEAGAALNSRSSGYKPGSDVKRLGEGGASEVKEMAAAVKAKFEGKIPSWAEENRPTTKSCKAGINMFAFQSLGIRAVKANIDKSNKLKGTTDVRPEQGWAFSLTLVDRGIYDFVPEQPKPEDIIPEGVDAL